jgi:two-component system NtrC family sensor kinase
MATIGQLAAGIAHEINNSIGFSLSNLTTLSEYVESFIKLDKLVVSSLPTLENHALDNQYQVLRKQKI